MIRTARVVLEEADFADLVKGRQVTVTTRDGTKVEIILADIGFDRMLAHLSTAIDESAQ